MAVSVKKVAADALGLPSAGRALIVEKLLDSLAGKADPAIEHSHLAEIRQRRESVRAGKSKLIDGATALRHARAALRG